MISTLAGLLRAARQSVQARPFHEVEWLFAVVLKLSRAELYLRADRIVEAEERKEIAEGIERLSRGEPLSYILGRAHFYANEYIVTPDVLIPRPETELLVEKVACWMKNRPVGSLVDLCTGSGCVGISLKKLFPAWHVILIDISYKALDVARCNARGLEIELLQGDLLEPLKERRVDALVCNPPYLSIEEAEVLDGFEPRIALEAGETGLEIYQRIFEQLPAHMGDGSGVFFEIGAMQKDAIMEMAKRSYEDVISYKDLSGRDRIVSFVC